MENALCALNSWEAHLRWSIQHLLQHLKIGECYIETMQFCLKIFGQIYSSFDVPHGEGNKPFLFIVVLAGKKVRSTKAKQNGEPLIMKILLKRLEFIKTLL